MKKIQLILLAVLILVLGCSIKTNTENIIDVSKSTPTAIDDFWQGLISSEVTKENFSDSYYYSMLNETVIGQWTQQEITYLLKKCIFEDIGKNGNQSIFSFVKNRKTPFLYAVNTSTSIDCIHFLLLRENESRKFPDFKFLSFNLFVFYDGDNFDNVDTYWFEMGKVEDVNFSDTNDFINYINDEIVRFIFFERGWVDFREN